MSLYNRAEAALQINFKKAAGVGTPPRLEDAMHHAVFNGGALVAKQALFFTVSKSGVEQTVTRAAYVYPLAYGIFTVLIALFFGWLASAIFRRD